MKLNQLISQEKTKQIPIHLTLIDNETRAILGHLFISKNPNLPVKFGTSAKKGIINYLNQYSNGEVIEVLPKHCLDDVECLEITVKKE